MLQRQIFQGTVWISTIYKLDTADETRYNGNKVIVHLHKIQLRCPLSIKVCSWTPIKSTSHTIF